MRGFNGKPRASRSISFRPIAIEPPTTHPKEACTAHADTESVPPAVVCEVEVCKFSGPAGVQLSTERLTHLDASLPEVGGPSW